MVVTDAMLVAAMAVMQDSTGWVDPYEMQLALQAALDTITPPATGDCDEQGTEL